MMLLCYKRVCGLKDEGMSVVTNVIGEQNDVQGELDPDG